MSDATKSVPQLLIELADGGHERADELRAKATALRTRIRELRKASNLDAVRAANLNVVKAYKEAHALYHEVAGARG